MFRLSYSSFSNLNEAIAFSFSSHSRNGTKCLLPDETFQFQDTMFPKSLSMWFNMSSHSPRWPVCNCKFSRMRLVQEHCVQNSELRRPRLQFVPCTKVVPKRVQMGQKIGCFSLEKIFTELLYGRRGILFL